MCTLWEKELGFLLEISLYTRCYNLYELKINPNLSWHGNLLSVLIIDLGMYIIILDICNCGPLHLFLKIIIITYLYKDSCLPKDWFLDLKNKKTLNLNTFQLFHEMIISFVQESWDRILGPGKSWWLSHKTAQVLFSSFFFRLAISLDIYQDPLEVNSLFLWQWFSLPSFSCH